MKKLLPVFIALLFFSCNDGDFDTPEFEFGDTVNNCGEYVLYVTNSNSTEILVMTLINNQLNTTVGEKSYTVSSSLQVVYRLFDEGISTNYFCQDIPPTTPKVITELDAENATINIITAQIFKNGVLTGYSYKISMTDLLFVDGNERIYYESFPFGTFIISI